ncbi:MAG: flagellar biosynthetic protein FliO [Anaerolineae bacterium]|nr:flagellar biosynthetic protein FliO [Anaerolineae bacterium]
MNNPFDNLHINPHLKRLLPYIISALLLFAVLIGSYLASRSADQTAATALQNNNLGLSEAPSTFDITLDVILKIFFVFGLIYACFALLRMWQKKQPGQVQSRLKIIETVRPSARQTFYLVRVDSQEFLVGATDQSMNLISEIEAGFSEENDVVSGLAENKDKTMDGRSFSEILQQNIKPAIHLFRQPPDDPDNNR